MSLPPPSAPPPPWQPSDRGPAPAGWSPHGVPGSGGYGGYGPPGGFGSDGSQRTVRAHPNGTTILVLGVLSLVICAVLGPFAWVMGNQAMSEIQASPEIHWSNEGNVTAGRILGIISTCILIGALALLTLAVIVTVNTN